MKILKAFLLIFIILFAVNNINAQEASEQDIVPNNGGIIPLVLNMQVEPFSAPLGSACFEVTVTSNSLEYLYIKSFRTCVQETEDRSTSFTTIVCFGPEECGPNQQTPFVTTIECGAITGVGTYKEGCDVTVDF